jgi:hypothetical protein
MNAMLDACLEKMDANLDETGTVRKSRRKRSLKTNAALEERYVDRHLAEETDSGRWWVAEEIDIRLQMDDPPCRARNATTKYRTGAQDGNDV